MNDAVVLDSGPLGILAHPGRTKPHVATCWQWFLPLAVAGRRIIVPEVADYEVRRELLRLNKVRSLAALDALIAQFEYLAISTVAMRQAAAFWAQARRLDQPTASDTALDADAILAGQAATLGVPAIVATTNAAHLSRFVPADHWQNIV